MSNEIFIFSLGLMTYSDLSRGVLFFKLDAYSGFWQVKLDSECKLLTTFLTPWGRFCFKRMSFGILPPLNIFKAQWKKIVMSLEGMICMMDKILVYGNNSEEHWIRIKRF